MKQIFSLCSLCVFLSLVACQKEDGNKVYQYQSLSLPATPFNYKDAFNTTFQVKSSSNFGPVLNLPTDNQITDAGATLGRVLFYDKILSENNTTACGSCHQQSAGFSDNAKRFSIGFEGNLTTRNSMSIVNTADNGFYFWDGRSATLEDLALQPVRNHIEMGIDRIANLEKKLAQAPYYPELFEKAFGSKEITREKVSKALSQFVHSLASRSSRFDDGLKNNFANFTESEKRGEKLFTRDLYCGQCHNGSDLDNNQVFSIGWGSDISNLNKTSANIGLDNNYQDNGMGSFENNSFSNGKFKVPTLRNIALTAPYMHDGRFKTLEEVINHYSDGVMNHPNLDSRIRFFNQQKNWNGGGLDTTQNRHIRLSLDSQQKADLIAFLNTLTDKKFITDEKFSNPFK